MHWFGRNDLTQVGGSLRNTITMSCISGTSGNNFLNSYDITKGKLLRHSIAFSFAYVVSSCITGDLFCQLCSDNIFSTIK